MAHQKQAVKALVPWLLAPMIVPIIRSSQVKRCTKAGFQGAANYAKTVAATERVAGVLGDKPYLLGDAPRSYDCAVWANLLQVAHTRSANAGREAVRARPELLAYIERLAERANLSLPAL
jgi:glutathione S-transferase